MDPTPRPSFLRLSYETWEVIGSAATAGAFIVAAVAVIVAIVQLFITSATRLDQNRPYVLVTFEPDEVAWGSINIVVRNVGKGSARNVRIKANPELKRADESSVGPIASARYFSEPIPIMPPGYALKTHLDTIKKREKANLPMRYEFTVTYTDSRRRRAHKWEEKVTQDIALMDNLLFTDIYTIHHAVKELRSIHDVLSKSAVLKERQIPVVTERREDHIQRKTEEHRIAQQQHEELLAQVKRAQERHERAKEDEASDE